MTVGMATVENVVMVEQSRLSKVTSAHVEPLPVWFMKRSLLEGWIQFLIQMASRGGVPSIEGRKMSH